MKRIKPLHQPTGRLFPSGVLNKEKVSKYITLD